MQAMSRLTEMVQFLYGCQRMRFAEQWTADPAIPAEFKRRWPDATEAETVQAREMAFELFTADAKIIDDKNPPVFHLPGWH